MSSLWLVCLSLLVAADAASLGGRPVDIPVQVVYDQPLDSLPLTVAVSAKNLDAKLQLSPEEVVEAEVLHIPVTVAKLTAEASSSSEEESGESAEKSSEEDSREDERNELHSDKNTLAGIGSPVAMILPPPISVVEVAVLPDLVPPPLVVPEVLQQEVLLIPEAVLPPQLDEELAGAVNKAVEQEQEINRLKSLLPEAGVAVQEELVQEAIKLKAMQAPREPTIAAVPELYPQEEINVLVQLRDGSPQVPGGNVPNPVGQASATPAPSGPLAGLFNRLGENIGNVLNSIRPSTVAPVTSSTTTMAANVTAATVTNDDNTRAGEDAAAPAASSEAPAASSTVSPASFLGGIQQNVNLQLSSFGDRVNGFINNLRPKQPETAQSDEQTSTPSTPLLNAMQEQFNNGLTGFSHTVNNAFNFIQQNNQPGATEPVAQQSDEQPGAAQQQPQPGNPIMSQITSSAQQFQQQFTNFVQNLAGQQQQQQQQQGDEQPEQPANNNPNWGQQVLTNFQNNMNSFMQIFNGPNGPSTTPGTQSDEGGASTPPPNNNGGGLFGGIQNIASNLGQQFNNLISGGQNPPNPTQGIPTQISQAGQQIASAGQNIPGVQQIQAGVSQLPGAEQVQNLQQTGAEQIQNLQQNLPGTEQIQNLQQNLPGAEQIQNLQQNLPGAEQVQNLQQSIPGGQKLQEILPSGKQIQSPTEKPLAAAETPVQSVEETEKLAEVAKIPSQTDQKTAVEMEKMSEAVTQV